MAGKKNRKEFQNNSCSQNLSRKKATNQLAKKILLAFKGDDLELAIKLLLNSHDKNLYEYIIKGSSISKGFLVPGDFLNHAKDEAEIFGLIALCNAPEPLQSLDKSKVKYWNPKTSKVFEGKDGVAWENSNHFLHEIFGKYVCPKAPNIKILKKYYIWDSEIISEAAATALGRHVGSLSIIGTGEQLNETIAKLISNHEGMLHLDNIFNLSFQTAKGLGSHKGGLSLEYLENLSVQTAKEISKLKGDLVLSFERSMSWYGLEKLNAGAAKAISQIQGNLFLSGLKRISDPVAKALANHKGELELRGLKRLSDIAAEYLSKHEGDLDLEGLTSLSDAAAESLSKLNGNLDLSGLERLSEAAAKSLSKHIGNLYLNGLQSLSNAAAAALRNHKGYLELELIEDSALKSILKV